MSHIHFGLVLLAVFFMNYQVSADEQKKAPMSHSAQLQIHKVTLDVPLQPNEASQNIIVEKLTNMEQQRFVYLDLSISFPMTSKGALPYTQFIDGKLSNSKLDKAEPCEIGPLLMGPGVSYEIGPVANYNHLLMTVFTGDRSAFPYSDVACEYVSSGEIGSFHVRGFFHIVANAIPTAMSLQLRPMNPPFEVAAKVLAR